LESEPAFSQPGAERPAPVVDRQRWSAGLRRLLVVKSFLELALVSGVALTFYLSNVSQNLRGAVDVVSENEVSGWVFDKSVPATAIEVQLFLNNSFYSAAEASMERGDIVAAGIAQNSFHGFRFQVEGLSPGHYTVVVYAVNRASGSIFKSLQVIGRPSDLEVAR
jgi:hypothetical protein